MKRRLVLLLVSFAAFVKAGPSVQAKADREPLILYATQQRYTAADLKAHHEHMRKLHKNYIPYFPDAPIITTISVGTPAKLLHATSNRLLRLAVDYNVSLESGSEAIFLLDKNYPGRLDDQPFYDSAQSSTSQVAGDYTGFSGDLHAFGTAYDDVVAVFGYGQYVNGTQRFGVVNEISHSAWFDPLMVDGVVGLSWNPADAANPNENSAPVINLFKEMGPEYGRFWCEILEMNNHATGQEKAVITSFGFCFSFCSESTPSNTYPLVWLEETQSLAFSIDSFSFNGQQFVGGYGKVDTGVPHLLLPYDPYLAVVTAAKASFNYQYYAWTVNCDESFQMPNVAFTIGGNEYSILASDYVLDLGLDDNQCVLGFYYSGDAGAFTTDYVLGYIFHNLWCIKMDVDTQSISFLHIQQGEKDDEDEQKKELQ